MNDNRGRGDGRHHDGSVISDVVAKIRRAIEMNDARESAIEEALLELGLGSVPDGWPSFDMTPEQVRCPLYEAEALLEKQVISIPVEHDGNIICIPFNNIEELKQFDCNAVRNMMIGETLFRLNASWSYIDIVKWEPLVQADAFPLLFRILTLPLGKPDKKHQLIGEEHNRSGIHFHYARLDGARSNILFAFGKNPPEPKYPVKWERHGGSKAKIKPNPKPENWNYNKRKNINKICEKAREKLPPDTRFFTPSKESQFLLPM